MTAWVVRAGVFGERDQWALANGLAGGGFIEFPDLTGASSRESLRAIADNVMAGEDKFKIANFTGQMWALRSSIKPGDLIMLPLKTTKKLAFGQCTGGYEYMNGQPEDRRHAIRVEWKRTDVPRSAIKDDLLNTINGAMTIFSATRNNAEARLRAVLENGVDPGLADAALQPAGPPGGGNVLDQILTDPTAAITVEAIRDRVRTHLTENFSGHKLTALVADILRALGYTCAVSPAGPDFGVDILAGRGPLGLDSPTVVVEVKSESNQIGVPVLNQLQGAVTSHQADQALLVAWGGLNKQAEQLRLTQRLKVQVWTDEDVLDRLFETYEQLPDTTRSLIPLKRAWVLSQETG
jgi:restriction system protein